MISLSSVIIWVADQVTEVVKDRGRKKETDIEEKVEEKDKETSPLK